MLTPEEMVATCLDGFLLPSFANAQPVMFKPETVSWDSGVITRRAGKELFVMVLPSLDDQKWLDSMTVSFQEVGIACIAIEASDTKEIAQTGKRVWVYNARIHGAPTPPVPSEKMPEPVIEYERSEALGTASRTLDDMELIEPATEMVDIELPDDVMVSSRDAVQVQATPVHVQAAPLASLQRFTDENGVASGPIWTLLGDQPDNWDNAERTLTELLPDETIEHLATRLFGQEKGNAWMHGSLLLLGGLSPAQACAEPHQRTVLMSILRKAALLK